MATTLRLLDWSNGDSGLTINGGLTGQALKVLRVNAAEDNFELVTEGISTLNATSPLFVSGTGASRTLSLAGLTTTGSSGQVVVSTGTVWAYQNSTGTGDIVRAASPTVTGTLTAAAVTATGVITFSNLSGTASAFRPLFANATGVISAKALGSAGQALRLASDGLNWEYFTPEVGDITSITATSPVIVTSGTGPIPNVTLAGLTTTGASGQVVTSTGTVWAYVDSTGTGNVLRSTALTAGSLNWLTSGTLSVSGTTSLTGRVDMTGGGGSATDYLFKMSGTARAVAAVNSAQFGMTYGTSNTTSITQISISGSSTGSFTTSGDVVSMAIGAFSKGASHTISGNVIALDIASITAAASGSQLAIRTGATGGILFGALAGTGTRIVSASSTGVLSSIATTGSGSVVLATVPTLAGASITGTAFTLPGIATSGKTTLLQVASGGGVSGLALGTAGQALRVNTGATGLEWFSPEVGDVTSVTGTSPIIVTSGTGPIPNVTLAGLTTVGTSGQVPISNGSVWAYVSSTGTGNVVRVGGATVSYLTSNDFTIGGSAFTMGASTMGYFGKSAVNQKAVTAWTNTAFPNAVTDNGAFQSQMSNLASWMIQIQGGLGDVSGYGILHLA